LEIAWLFGPASWIVFLFFEFISMLGTSANSGLYLYAAYAAERDGWQDKTLLVVSDEPYFPWELIWPYGDDWEDDAPWCATLRLTRWLRRDAQGNGHEAPPARLPFNALACLAPTDSGLLAAQYEHAYLSNLVSARGMTDLSPAPPTWSKVMDLLEGGGYDWFHVAAHGSFRAEAPDADSAIWLEGDRAMTPDDFVGLAIERHLRERRPAFVFNACHSSRQDWDLTRLGGWANRLVSGGAGLFLAPMWTVSDKPALAFAEAFYEALVGGSNDCGGHTPSTHRRSQQRRPDMVSVQRLRAPERALSAGERAVDGRSNYDVHVSRSRRSNTYLIGLTIAVAGCLFSSSRSEPAKSRPISLFSSSSTADPESPPAEISG
jgi:hypothetical protein